MIASEYDAIVIGAGPGGYVAAIRLAQLKQKTLVVERDALGGTCLNYGCIPSKALIHAAKLYESMREAETIGLKASGVEVDWKKVQEWRAGIVKHLTGGIGQLLKARKVDVTIGEARVTGPNEVEVSSDGKKEKVHGKNILVAVGGKPIEIPGFPFDGKRVISSKEALELPKIPKRMVLIGGGVIGLEIGTLYAKFGTEVTVIEMMDQVLPGTDPELVKVVARNLKKKGIKVHTGAKASGVKKAGGGLEVSFEAGGKKQSATGDVVLVAVGVGPVSKDLGLDKAGVKTDKRGFVTVDERMRTSVPSIYAIGDVAGPPLLAHKASKEGMIAAEAMAGMKTIRDIRAMPAAIFTDPEIATVGMSEPEAKEQGREVVVGKFPFTASGRALAAGRTDGFVKVTADKKTGELLGVGIVGAEASELIAEAALAIEMGGTVEDLALTVHTHPTLSEGVMEAAEAALGHPIHSM